MVVKPGLAPIFRVPLLVNVPVPILIEPPLVMTAPTLLISEALLERLKMAPWLMLTVPALAAKPDVVVSVPALTPRVPLLVKLLGLMRKVWPAVLPIRVPALTTLARLLWLMPP